MTKEEILKKHCQFDGQFLDEHHIDGYTENVYSAMDEYAKQQSIAYNEWMEDNHFVLVSAYGEEKVWRSLVGKSMIPVSSEELYSLFLESTNNPQNK